MTSCVIFFFFFFKERRLFSFICMCMCFVHQYQYQLLFEWSLIICLCFLDVRERMSVAEILVINAVNVHVADTGFLGTLNEVKSLTHLLSVQEK